MCTTCGCGTGQTLINGKPLHKAHRHGGPMHFRACEVDADVQGVSASRIVKLEQDLLAKNNGYAEANRSYLSAHGIFALNLVSSPGSGKTTLLVKTIAALNGSLPLAVIEGDQQTNNDARASAPPVRQPSRSTPARAAIWMLRWSARPCGNWGCRTTACC